MEKKTLYAVVVLLLLGGLAVFVLRSPEKGQQTGPAPRPIPVLKEAEIAAIDLTTAKGGKVALSKKGDAWQVASDKRVEAADKNVVKPLLDGLTKLGFGDPVTEEPTKYEELGVADGKAPHLVVKDGAGKVLADLYVGKAVGGFVMVRPIVGTTKEVWQATGLAPYILDKEAKQWRNHALIELTPADADELSVVSGSDALVVAKKGADPADKAGALGSWSITRAAGNAPTAAQLDVAEVEGTIGQLAQLRASDFADDKKAADVGLEPPALTVTVDVKGTKHTLLVGNRNGDDIYVKLPDRAQIFTLKQFAVERVAHRPTDYRDKTLLAAKEADLAEINVTVGTESITLTHGSDGWKSPSGALDDSKVKGLVAGLDRIAGERFGDANDMLGAPSGSITVKRKDGTTVALRAFGNTKDGQNVYVQKVGKPETLVVKKWTLDRVLKKPSELLKDNKAGTKAAAAPANDAATTKKSKVKKK